MTATISKAQLKKEKEINTRLYSLVSSTIVDFKDSFLESFVDFRIKEIENNITRLQDKKINWTPTRYETTIPDFDTYISRVEKKLSNKNILVLEFITEADKNFESKLNSLVSKLVEYKFTTRYLSVKKISNAGSEFSFLVSNQEIEVEARVIFACGDINVPHYRFITTKRNL
jgi:hypothetical protein